MNKLPIKPLLLHVYRKDKMRYPCIMQPKLNGIRALYYNGKFYTRKGIAWYDRVVKHIVEKMATNESDRFIFDGEFYVHGWNLQRISKAISINLNEPTAETPLVQFHCYDVFDQKNPFHDFSQRHYAGVSALVSERIVPTITIVEGIHITNENELEPAHRNILKAGYEGSVLRLLPCTYSQKPDGENRSWSILKYKPWLYMLVRVLGIKEGAKTDLYSKYVGSTGSLICNTPDGVSFNVGSGLTDIERKFYWEHSEEIVDKMITIRYECLSETGVPLKPTYRGIGNHIPNEPELKSNVI